MMRRKEERKTRRCAVYDYSFVGLFVIQRVLLMLEGSQQHFGVLATAPPVNVSRIARIKVRNDRLPFLQSCVNLWHVQEGGSLFSMCVRSAK